MTRMARKCNHWLSLITRWYPHFGCGWRFFVNCQLIMNRTGRLKNPSLQGADSLAALADLRARKVKRLFIRLILLIITAPRPEILFPSVSIMILRHFHTSPRVFLSSISFHWGIAGGAASGPISDSSTMIRGVDRGKGDSWALIWGDKPIQLIGYSGRLDPSEGANLGWEWSNLGVARSYNYTLAFRTETESGAKIALKW